MAFAWNQAACGISRLRAFSNCSGAMRARTRSA
jgi:hypothetical protein